MKTTRFFFMAMSLCGAVALLSACNDKEKQPAPKYNLTVNITMPEDVTIDEVASIKITAVNAEKELTYSSTALASECSFEVAPGQYNITVSGSISETFSISGATTKDVFEDATASVSLVVVPQSPLVFKEIYTTSYDWYLNDAYYEIVNNSDEVQYLDGCILGYMTLLQNPTAWVDGGKQMDKYPLYGYVVAFPGSGTDHPLQPGASVVVANDASNHKTLGATGRTQDEADKFPNLSNAPWEVYLSPEAGRWYTDIDYPASNMTVIYSGAPSVKAFMGGVGGMGMVLARLPQGVDPLVFASDAANKMVMPGVTTPNPTMYLMMPGQYVLDGVEIVDKDVATPYKNFLAKDDAGYTHNTSYSALGVRRKVVEIKSGRAVYKDTNNSADDFLTNQPLTPGIHPSVVD